MLYLPGYKLIETVHEGVSTVIYRAHREVSPTTVIIKTIKAEYPTLEEIARLRHEYKILHSLNIEGIIKPLVLEKHKNGIAIILEDFGSDSLKIFTNKQKISLISFIEFGIKVSSILEKLHQNNIIHKDIKPHNILINSDSRQFKLIDFSIATRLSRETQTLSNPTFLEGTLAYMSPEQTGRMNRSIDYRTDFYSLGVTFYELLTGQLPFKATDPMELVHCHIAKTAVPPTELNPEIPKAVSDIVMKLLAKTAEDRYQSAYGLKVDLEQCLTQLQQTGHISNFIPGQRDKSGQFLIPQKLYGREAEVTTLMDAFDRVSAGTTELMLVSGYSGIGKSCLVQEVHKPIVRQRGYFIAGKFDQFKRNIPYAALIQAFQELICQLLTESADKIALWKEKLLNALGQNGQVIVDVIPEVELIIGEQPDVPQLGSSESQNRFNRVFKQFIHVFTQKEHPLVLFLDDLQWADSASLKLMQMLITDLDSQYLLLIGAYRDNEVSATHPLMMTLNEIDSAGARINNIILQPLDISHVTQLVAETLNETHSQADAGSERSKLLAELVFNKTQGNPFFLTQLLQTLYAEKLLTFDFNSSRWQWEIEQIQAIGITDYNVVELVARNIQKLPLETQNVLKLAACIGNRFNLDVLGIVNEKSISETAADLWDALQAGLILPVGGNAYKIPLVFDREAPAKFDEVKVSYKFLHDRVQQAAYSLIPEDQKKATHLKIGQLLLQKTAQDALEENIFDIVNQLNFGVEFLIHQEEKDHLARLNLIAGRKAKAATAYEAATKYLTVGLELLAEDSWQSHYGLTLDLYVEATEAEYLNTNFERSETLAEVVLQHATTLLDQVKVYELQIQFYIAQNQRLKAIDIAFCVLERLGVSLECAPSNGGFVVELPQIEDLKNLPEMTDPYKLAALRILLTVLSAAYAAKPEILPLLILTQVNLCIKYGHSALAAYVYGWYGLLLCGTGELDTGYHSGQLALKLLDQFDAKELKAKVYNLFNNLIRHWKEHVRETITPCLEGLQSGLETGDLEYVGYLAMVYCCNIFLIGNQLEIVAKQQTPYLDLLLNLKQEHSLNYSKIWRQLTLNLLSETEDKCQLIGESFNEAKMLPLFLEANNHTLLAAAYLAKAILLYLFKDYAQAVANAYAAAEHAEGMMGLINFAVHNFYYSLALLAQYPNASKDDQQQYMSLVEANQQKMQLWASHAPCNFEHKYHLVEAEKARVLGQIAEAMEYYDRAITGAKEQGYIQEEALANELAAEFYFSLGRDKIAQMYLTESYYGYIAWGAKAKVQDLESRYPQVFFERLKREPINVDVTRTTVSTSKGNLAELDLSTVSKAALALAGEILLDKLLDKLLKIVMENAGARTSCFILEKDGELLIEATGNVGHNKITLCPSIPIENNNNLPVSVISYVARTKSDVVLNDATKDGLFARDHYIVKNQPKSILCTPIINQGQLIGILYLENDITPGAFTLERMKVLKLLSSQIAISLKNALLYANLETTTENLKRAKDQLEDYSRTLEQKVAERTLELKEKYRQMREQATQLEQALQQLQATQTQLIQTEKMSSLGQMVAGVAHEINNPVNFIYGNLTHTGEYFQNLLELLHLYQQQLPNPTPDIQGYCDAIDLEFLSEDVPRLLHSMQVGAQRIRQIVLSLRNFSRLDEAEMKPVDIHQGIDSTLMILQHRLKEKAGQPEIQVIKEYGKLPRVECYAGHLNQVFMNILANCIDALQDEGSRDPSRSLPLSVSVAALEEQALGAGGEQGRMKNSSGLSLDSFDLLSASPWIRINTSVIDGDRVVIRIADNGPGMTEEVSSKIFDPFFTTKPVGAGTGLGLSISYQIVVDRHKGELKCISAPGQGAEFVIEIPVKQV